MQSSYESDSDSSVGEAPNFASKALLAHNGSGKRHAKSTGNDKADALISSQQEELSLEIEPKEVSFEDIAVGSNYTAVLRLRNTSLLPQRIRISRPRTRHFKVEYEPSGPIAPGLEITAQIVCRVPEAYDGSELLDVIVVQGQTARVQVPLMARAPRADIVFDSFANLGVFGLDCPAKKTIRLTNQGSIAGEFLIEFDKSLPMTISPDRGVIPAARGKQPNYVDVIVEFVASALGPFRTVARVTTPGHDVPQLLDISAQVVSQILTLVRPNGGGIIDAMDFGTVFYSKSASQSAILVNNRPQPVSFQITLQSANLSPTERFSGAEDDGAVKVNPTQGILKPYAQIPLQIDFAPAVENPDKAFRHEFEEMLKQSKTFEKVLTVEAQDVEQTVEVAISGIGCGVNYTMSPRVFRFGGTAVYQRRDIVTTFKNNSQLPVRYQFPKVAHFKVSPSEGTLAAGQTQPFTVSFIPPQLGEFKSKIHMILEGGVVDVELRVMGSCSDVGERRQLIGGPTALPEHFAPDYRFVNPKEIPKSSAKKFVRPRPWENMNLHESMSWDELAPRSAREAQGAEVTYSIQELGRRADHRQQYNQYLSKARAKRQEQTALPASSDDPFGVDLGMDRALDEPDLPIPPAVEQLFLQNAVNGDSSNPRQRIPADENKLIVKKFRAAPGTQAEFRDCDAELTSEQLHKIVASHKVLNFGQISKTSSVAKCFAIVNDHSASILVTIDTTDKELKECAPRSQVIPPGATAGFDIRLLALNEGPIRQIIHWTINGKHTFKLVAAAEVVPLEVVLSASELRMAFSDDCLEPSVSQVVQMTNTGNVAAEFTWGNSGSFEAQPESGIIPAHSTQDVNVVWTPSSSFPNKQVLQLSILNGLSKSLQVTGELGDIKCQFENKKLDFGTCPINHSKTASTKIKNIGSAATVVFLDQPHERYGLHVKPAVARILPGEVLDVELTLTPPRPFPCENVPLLANVRGGRAIRLLITATIVVPSVEMSQTSFDFGDVVVGAGVSHPLTIANTGTIPAALIFDNSFQPCFRLSHLALEDDESNVGANNPCTIELISNKQALQVPRHTGVGVPSQDQPATGRWKVIIPPNVTFHGYLTFQPISAPATFDFELPLHLEGMHDDQSLCKGVVARALPSKLSLSTHLLDFGDKVIQREESARISHGMEFDIANPTREAVTWQLAVDGIGDDTMEPEFYLSPTAGILAPGEKTTIRATFMPARSGEIVRYARCYEGEQPDLTKPYLSVCMRGCAVYPRLSFDTEEVVFPSVPLEVTSRAQFTVINQGFESVELNYRVSQYIPVNINVEIVDGAFLNSSRVSATVNLSFAYNKPIAFSGAIEFYDSDGDSFRVMIRGRTDNCLLSTQPFLSSYKSDFALFTSERMPIKLLDKQSLEAIRTHLQAQRERERKERQLARQAELSPRHKKKGQPQQQALPEEVQSDATPKLTVQTTHVTHGAGVSIERQFPACITDAELSTTISWFNQNVCAVEIEQATFPSSIVATDGAQLLDAIEFISGKKIPGRPARAATVDRHTNRLQKAVQLNEQMKEFVKFMIQCGALVGVIEPQALLAREYYPIAKEIEAKKLDPYMTAKQLRDKKALWDEQWPRVSKIAWAEVMYQTIRVFALARVTPASVTTVAAVPTLMPYDTEDFGGDGAKKKDKASTAKAQKARRDPELHGSNVYSSAEAILLRWVSYHVNKTCPTVSAATKRIIDFEAPFRNGAILCHLLHSHLPQLASSTGPLCDYVDMSRVDELDVPHIAAENVSKALHAMSLFRLDIGWEPDHILQGTGRMFLVLLLHLYHTLPNLIPKATIEFTGAQGRPIVKNIELTNPSARPVKYEIQLEGCQDFSISKREILIDPGKMIQLPITYLGRFSKKQTARITFWGMRMGSVSSATMVFDLVSNITEMDPQQHVSVETRIYDMKVFSVTVRNPYDKACSFSVTCGKLKLVLRDPVQELDPTRRQRKQMQQQLSPQQHGIQKRGSAASPTSKAAPESADDLKIKAAISQPFWITQETVNVPAGGSVNLQVGFLPWSTGTFTCPIVFIDSNVGETCVMVQAEALLPKPIDSVSVVATLGSEEQVLRRVLRLPMRNTMLEKGVTNFVENRLPTVLRNRGRALLLNMLQQSSCVDGRNTFALQVDSPYFSVPEVMELQLEAVASGTATGSGVTKGPGRPHNAPKKLSFDEVSSRYSPDLEVNSVVCTALVAQAGSYSARVVLHPQHQTGEPADIRVFELHMQIHGKPEQLSLHFSAPSREAVVQQIPFHNESDQPWRLEAQITQQGRAFSGARSLTVPAGEKVFYDLSFKPDWMMEYEAALIVKNLASGDTLEYKLIGMGEEPLASAHEIIHCRAREPYVHDLLVKHFQPVAKSQPGEAVNQVTVVTDLPYVSGPDTIEIAPQGQTFYPLTIQAPLGGVFSGSISFTDSGGIYQWYTVEIDAEPAAAESTVSVSAQVRSAVSVGIVLINPLESRVTFAVELQGDGLIGDPTLTLRPKEEATYDLIYSPLFEGATAGFVRFIHPELGEISHALELLATPAPPTELPAIECVVGGTCRQSIPIDNPLAQEVTLTVEISDPQHFAVEPPTITLSPYQQSSFELLYIPSGFHTTDQATVKLSQAQFGSVIFSVTGHGLVPSVMPESVAIATVGTLGSTTIHFRNAFAQPLPIDVMLTASQFDDAELFALMLRRTTGVVVAPGASISIGVSFSPPSICEATTSVEIRGTFGRQQLRWVYPIRGVTEAARQERAAVLACKAKQTIVHDLELPLAEMIPSLGTQSISFNHELIVPEDVRAVVSRSFQVQALRTAVSGASGSSSLLYRLIFEPLKPFAASVELVCSKATDGGKATGGRWRYEIVLDATDPEVDDEIHVMAAINSSSSVVFPITNRFLGYSPFRAYFTSNSSPAFSVSPLHGVLPPFDSDGQEIQFTVTYSPKEYGKRNRARLVIQTDETMWSYEVVGEYPGFEPPTHVQTKLDTYISPDLARRLGRGTRRARHPHAVTSHS